jgi:hypothetical protein
MLTTIWVVAGEMYFTVRPADVDEALGILMVILTVPRVPDEADRATAGDGVEPPPPQAIKSDAAVEKATARTHATRSEKSNIRASCPVMIARSCRRGSDRECLSL